MLAAVISGGTTAYVAGRRVLPASTLAFGRGLPAILAMRGVLTYGYFGSLKFFPIALELVRGLNPTWFGRRVSAPFRGYCTRPSVGVMLIIIGMTGTAGTLVHAFPIALAIAC
jgi:hypothetical protein